ncbi:MAG: energy transducer TonB [Flavobacterium sp.]|nr:energy transducer TonB [Flavobacterium sp.]
MIEIIIKIVICQFAFLLIYETVLKRETFFQWNRVYLLITAVLSFVIPFLKISWFNKQISENISTSLNEIVLNASTNKITNTVHNSNTITPNFEFKLEFLVLVGSLVFLFLFIRKFYLLHKIKQKCKKTIHRDYIEYQIPNSDVAFSFLNNLFIGEKINSNSYVAIVSHEIIHIKQKHSYDLLFFETLRIIFWFNPLIYLYQKYCAEVHEFIADQCVDKHQNNYEILLQEIFGTENFSFTNQFFSYSLIKKRIIMLNRKSKKSAKFKFLAVIPCIFLLLFMVSSSEIQAQEQNHLTDQELIEKIYKELKLNSANGQSIYEQIKKNMVIDKIEEDKILSREEYYRLVLILKLMMEEAEEKGIAENKSSYFDVNKRTYEEYLTRKKQELEDKQKSASIKTIKYELPQEIIHQEIIPLHAADQAPLFENCIKDKTHDCFQNELNNHIRKNFYYPEEAMDKGISGRVFVNFVITDKGNIVIKGIRAPAPILEKSVYELMMKLPVLKPAIHNGKAVSINMSMPISFVLDTFYDEDKK